MFTKPNEMQSAPASRQPLTRVHFSLFCHDQATADELIKAGKESWLIRRTETVMAKGTFLFCFRGISASLRAHYHAFLFTGKGEMTTYFVTVKGANKTNSSATSDPIGESFSSDCRRGRSNNSGMLPSLLDLETAVEV